MQYSGDWRRNTVSNRPTAVLSIQFVFDLPWGFMIRESKSATTNYFCPPLDKGAGSPVGWFKNYCMIVTSQGSRALVQPRARNLNYPSPRFMISSSFAQSSYEYNTSICPFTQRTNQLGIWHTHTLLSYTVPMLSSTSTSYLPSCIYGA